MTGLWQLPRAAELEGQQYAFRADFRDVLQILFCLDDPELPVCSRWLVALKLFYKDPIPRQLRQRAMEYLAWFLSCGEPEQKGGAKLLDWQQDAQAIIAGVNHAAGQEVRALPFVHWWTFLSWFHSMPPGQLSTVVSIRDKLARGKKLEGWEKDFYRENKTQIEIKPRLSRQEEAERERLRRMLNA